MHVRITHPRMDFFYMEHPALAGRFPSGSEHDLPDGFDLRDFDGLNLRVEAVEPDNTPTKKSTPAKKGGGSRGKNHEVHDTPRRSQGSHERGTA